MKKLSLKEADDLALSFRTEYGIGNSQPFHAKTILRKLNILTVYRPLSENLHGLSLKSRDGKCFMLVNSSRTRGHQHFTIAHELYHLFYEEHPIPHIDEENEGIGRPIPEQNADAFASALLLPSNAVKQMIPESELQQKNVSIATILKIEQFFSVSRKALLNRLLKLKYITQEQYDSLSSPPVKWSAGAYGYDLSLYEPGNENLIIGDFGEKARLLFENEKISEGHYHELMQLIGYGES